VLSVIIVSWNAAALTDRCLRSLRSATLAERTEVILVDNGSTDGTVEMVRSGFPEVTVIVNPSNEGYTRANNSGIAVATGRYILLLNSDAFVDEDCVRRLIEQLERRPHAAAVAPRLVYGDGSWQRWTAGSAPTLRTAANHYLFLERLRPGHPAFAGLYLGADVREPRRVDWVSSACMLLRSDALRAVGGLDERLFVYMDDVDLCQRLRDAGWEVWYCPEAQCTHLMGQIVRGQASGPPVAALRSFDRYFSARHGRGAVVTLRAMQVVGFGLRAAAYRAAALIWRRPLLATQAKSHFASLILMLRGGFDTR
jgi:GT2 family glycosyltransferase